MSRLISREAAESLVPSADCNGNGELIRKQIEKALQESEHHHRQILQGLPVALYTCDADGRIQFYNEASADLWGRRPALGEEWCGSYKIFWPDGTPVPLAECPMAIALKEGRTVRGQEIVIERPDGTRRHVLPHPQPLRDIAGRLIGAINVLVDITEHKRAEENQGKLAAIVESSDDAIVGKTLDGVITSWNTGAQRIFGYLPQEAIGKHITMLIPPERLDEEQLIISRLRQGDRIEHYETIRVAQDGRRIDISLTVSPIRDGSGRIIGASKIARDIGIRKQAEEALREADRRKDEFLAMLAHELRNPLAPLRSSLQVIRLSNNKDEVIEQTRGIMQRQVDHMVRLIDDLLDVSRVSRGKLQLRKQRIALSEVVNAAVETSDPLIKQLAHKLTVTLPREPIFVDVDQTRLSQVLSNLLNNAAKYTPNGGRIWLRAEREGEQVVIAIKDTGCGIPPEMLERIFEMFTQVERTLESSHGGLGIGLTLVKRLVEMHGGTVEARSDGVGKGSDFILRLPLAASVIDELKSPSGDVPPATPSRRVLVADDNQDAAESMALMLELMGHEVRTARDGHEAVKLASAFRPELILLDLGMPGLNGYDAARLIREQSWGKDMRLVALTGWGQDEDKQRSRAAGFDHHVVKPAEPEVLEKILAS